MAMARRRIAEATGLRAGCYHGLRAVLPAPAVAALAQPSTLALVRSLGSAARRGARRDPAQGLGAGRRGRAAAVESAVGAQERYSSPGRGSEHLHRGPY